MNKREAISIAPKRFHYLGLALVIIMGIALRFGNLALKPLWLDEIITALFALGRQTSDIPLDRIFTSLDLTTLFTFNPSLSCPQIARTVAVESTHPPLFFCLMHGWLARMSGFSHSLAWQLRSLPALFGVGAIVAMYVLNRLAFSPAAGLTAAGLMAVSPFCVYLSQESRHYTLPLLLITLALIGLVQILQAWANRQPVGWRVWMGWVAANSLGLYVHYFFLLAFVAQLGTLLSFAIWRIRVWNSEFGIRNSEYAQSTGYTNGIRKPEENLASSAPEAPEASTTSGRAKHLDLLGFVFSKLNRSNACAPTVAPTVVLLPILLFVPWLPKLLGHLGRSETDWFKPFEPSWTDGFAPIYQTLAGWLVMVVSLPVEGQPLWIAITSGLLMVGFIVGLGRRVWQGMGELWQFSCGNASRTPARLPTFIFTAFTVWVLVEILAIVYLLDKDITAAPRYHFIYYPGVCALLGASLEMRSRPIALSQNTSFKSVTSVLKSPLSIALTVGFLSSLLTIENWVFHKPYYPDRIAEQMTFDRTVPLVMVVGYENLQEAALGLSFAMELEKRHRIEEPGTTHSPSSPQPKIEFAFLDRSTGYETLWQNLSELQPLPEPPFNLWVVGPGLRQAEYPSELDMATSGSQCDRDLDRYYRLGIPYQLYRCRQAQTSLSRIVERADI